MKIGRARIIAYQLSLFGDPPKACLAWRRSFWTWCLGGELLLPFTEAAERQRRMLTPSMAGEWAGALT